MSLKVYKARSLTEFSLYFLVWYGVIFIRMGSYQDGIFKFVMTIPENFPDGDCPVSKALM